MHTQPLYPLEAEAEALSRHCSLPLHIGTAKIGSLAVPRPEHPWSEFFRRRNPSAPSLTDVRFKAAFLMPAAAECLIFLQGPQDFRLGTDFYKDLLVSGDVNGQPFKLQSDEIVVRSEGEGPGESRWAIASPLNKPAELTYGEERPIQRVEALINNFNFDGGNEPKGTGKRDVLRVRADGRQVDFTKRKEYDSLTVLLAADIIDRAPMLTFNFDSQPESTEDELSDCAFAIAGLCGIVARQHTMIPLLTFLDADGQPIKRLLVDALTSSFRGGYILANLQLDAGLPQLFDECFCNYRRMIDSEHWVRLDSYCKSVEDQPYLEQKWASLTAGLESLMRSALIDGSELSAKDLEGRMLPDLIGLVRKKLSWDVPQHYTAKDRIRIIRNAVSHGVELPLAPDIARHYLDKWSLFLMRRVLMHLGFTGPVRSPNLNSGLWSSSKVDDFSEENNNFTNAL